VTTNMRDFVARVYQAGYSAGCLAAKTEVAFLDELSAGTVVAAMPPKIGNGTRKRVRKAAAKVASKIPAKTANVIARGVKKAPTPRTKGVKDEIVRLLSENPDGLPISTIIASTGFKENSIRGTLMGLKKDMLAGQDSEKRWILANAAASGNSDHGAAHADI
jgi:hypothetical protein